MTNAQCTFRTRRTNELHVLAAVKHSFMSTISLQTGSRERNFTLIENYIDGNLVTLRCTRTTGSEHECTIACIYSYMACNAVTHSKLIVKLLMVFILTGFVRTQEMYQMYNMYTAYGNSNFYFRTAILLGFLFPNNLCRV